VVPSLDRYGRTLKDLITMVGDLRKREIGFRSLHENLDTTTRALTWHTAAQIRYARTPTSQTETRSAVRISVYNDTHGPVQPDTFVMLAAQARRMGTPLPPLLLDAIRCMPFGVAVTPEQTTALRDFSQPARQAGDAERAASNVQGMNEERVIGEYISGARIDDTDDTFARRFLYAFWRLCEQRIAAVDDAYVGPTARSPRGEAGRRELPGFGRGRRQLPAHPLERPGTPLT
jgi:hypothetical protein